MPNKDFNLQNLPIEARDQSIRAEDFTLVGSANKIKEQKFQTKPTTFFKDSIKRFAKNKSSVVASILLGILLVVSFVEPLIDPYPVTNKNSEYMKYLEPKLFDSGFGFWDGTRKWESIPTYIPTLEDGTMDTNKDNWLPNPKRFDKNAVSKKTFTDFVYTSNESEYGKNGYIQFGFNMKTPENEKIDYSTLPLTETISLSDTLYLETFDTYNLEKLQAYEGEKEGVTLPENYTIGEAELYFCYNDEVDGKLETREIKLLDARETFDIGSAIASRKQPRVNLTEALQTALNKEGNTDTSFDGAYIDVRLVNEGPRKNTCALIKSIEFSIETSNADLKKEVLAKNFVDATENILRPYDKGTNPACWSCTGTYLIHMSQVVYCTFIYDSYKAVFGDKDKYNFDHQKIQDYVDNGWLKCDTYTDYDPVQDKYVIADYSEWEILDKKNCPINSLISITCSDDGETIFYNVNVSYYKYYGYKTMPKFLMGTDKNGNHMFRYVFEGLRTSLLLGIITFLVCFIFGLIWGSVSGYFGGIVDLAMERFTDILSGVPWIVLMTLAIIKFGSNMLTFAMALCLTGWIGTAATTRTQFYRFRGREYVLASRTLGASNARLIAKHILPNAMGTIITSAVLMIPSVIFSEATISYLGLGLTDQSSLGVILSNNQGELTSSPYLLIFPSIVIALIMISFNLFGNGLRDAVNPSLKGED